MQDRFLYRESFLNANEILHREFSLLAGLLDSLGLIDQVHFPVRALNKHIALPRLFIFSVEKYASGHTLKLAKRGDLQGKALVGNQCAMRCEHPLPIAALLYRAEYLFKIRLHTPLVRRDELREAHCLKVHKPCGNVFLEKLRGFGQGLVIRIGSH